MANHGNTPLHLAALFGDVTGVRKLVEGGASACQANDFGKLPEEVAKTSELRVILVGMDVTIGNFVRACVRFLFAFVHCLFVRSFVRTLS